MTEKEKRFDRIKGALYGVAVGDCLGAPVEFMAAKDIQARYGKVTEIMGGGWLGAHVGEGTDDTAMTLAVAEGLICTGPLDDPVEKIGQEFIKWFYDAPIGAGAACTKAIGIASKNGQVKAPHRYEWWRAAAVTHHALNGRSGGNGSLMRTLPIALFARKSIDRANLAWDVSNMTHLDTDAASACEHYCNIIAFLLRGHRLLDVLYTVTAGTEYEAAWTTGNFKPLPNGYVKNSFNTALWGIAQGGSFEDVLIRVVNLGGDADTTGAIVGGLAGALYGFSAIPKRWIGALSDTLKIRLDAVVDAARKVWRC